MTVKTKNLYQWDSFNLHKSMVELPQSYPFCLNQVCSDLQEKWSYFIELWSGAHRLAREARKPQFNNLELVLCSKHLIQAPISLNPRPFSSSGIIRTLVHLQLISPPCKLLPSEPQLKYWMKSRHCQALCHVWSVLLGSRIMLSVPLSLSVCKLLFFVYIFLPVPMVCCR